MVKKGGQVALRHGAGGQLCAECRQRCPGQQSARSHNEVGCIRSLTLHLLIQGRDLRFRLRVRQQWRLHRLQAGAGDQLLGKRCQLRRRRRRSIATLIECGEFGLNRCGAGEGGAYRCNARTIGQRRHQIRERSRSGRTALHLLAE